MISEDSRPNFSMFSIPPLATTGWSDVFRAW
jgi:hypothetical protein